MELKILSYNLAMLSWAMERGGTAIKENIRRSKSLLIQILNEDYDIICLQEIFDEGIREFLNNGLKNAGYYVRDKWSDDWYTPEDSGLFFACKKNYIKKIFS